jgi:histone-lysine N-methyltransferase SETMAR
MTGIPKTSVLEILKDKLGLRHVLLRWIPHSLSDAQKENRVSVARALLAELESTPFNKLGYLMTSDETWVTFTNPHSSMWARNRDEAGERARQTITKAKTLVVVFWGFTGFLYATTVPAGTTYNSAYVNDFLIPQLTGEVSKIRKIIGLKGTVLHWDNARAHTSRETRALLEEKKVKILPHPAYSPDLSPSDFFLFGTIKEKMKGTTFSTSDGVLDKISELWREITKETLLTVFNNWKMRLNFVIMNNGEYYHN